MIRFAMAIALVATNVFFATARARAADGADDAAKAAVRKTAEQVVTTFNAGKTDALAAMFLPQGELIDEQGTVYQGPQEIKAVLDEFFKQFPRPWGAYFEPVTGDYMFLSWGTGADRLYIVQGFVPPVLL